ncbi:MAG: hypothetical protein ACK55I_20130, partial [bacterium]
VRRKEDRGPVLDHRLDAGARLVEVDVPGPGLLGQEPRQLERVHHVGPEHVPHAGAGEFLGLAGRHAGEGAAHVPEGTVEALAVEGAPRIGDDPRGAEVLLRGERAEQPLEAARAGVLREVDRVPQGRCLGRGAHRLERPAAVSALRWSGPASGSSSGPGRGPTARR